MDDIKKAITKAIIAKNRSIKTFAAAKQMSMRDFAIRRDAASFAALTYKQFSGTKETDMLKGALAYWIKYLGEEIYKSLEALKEEHYQMVRASEHKAPLNHIDLTEEEIK